MGTKYNSLMTLEYFKNTSMAMAMRYFSESHTTVLKIRFSSVAVNVMQKGQNNSSTGRKPVST